jgi:site-specific recombinase XerD
MLFVTVPDRRIDDCPADTVRRRAMIWLLHSAGVEYATISAILGLAVSQVAKLNDTCERRLVKREQEAARWIEPWAKRLRAVRAIP